jgi:hypothetical protein
LEVIVRKCFCFLMLEWVWNVCFCH